MEVVPGESIGLLHFRMPPVEAVRLLGGASGRIDYGDGRCQYDCSGGVTLLFHDSAGLIAVTLGQGPAMLWGRDLFALAADELSAWLVGRCVGVSRQDDGEGDLMVVAEVGLCAYFAEGEPGPQEVEVFVGRWERGALVSL